MKAIILAAGRGSRMGNLTNETPKGLVRLKGRPLIDWQLEALRDAGIEEIGLVSGYRAERLTSYGLPIFHNPDWQHTNMLHSLTQASQWLRTSPCIVSYSDIFYSSQPVRALIASRADIGIAYDPAWLELWCRRFSDPLEDAETFRFDSTRNILLEIGQRPSTSEEVAGQYMGLLHFTPHGWAQVETLLEGLPMETAKKLDMTSLLSRLLACGAPIALARNEMPWGEVDSAQDLALYDGDPTLTLPIHA
nr:phosphocholine cytidylyltransferase family protein [Oryzomicrobium terrae]